MLLLIYNSDTIYGNIFNNYLSESGLHTVLKGKANLNNEKELEKEWFNYPVDRIIIVNDNQNENIQDHVINLIKFAIWAYKYNFHVTFINIFEKSSILSEYREDILKEFDSQILNLNFYNPLCNEKNTLFHNLVNNKIYSTEQKSYSVIDDIFPIGVDMILNKVTGLFNMQNNNYMNDKYILDLYKDIVDENYIYDEINTTGDNTKLIDNNRISLLYPDKITDIKISFYKFINNIVISNNE